MKLLVDQQLELSITNLDGNFEKAWASCLKNIYLMDHLIHHVEIDGQVFYSDYEKYIQCHLQSISKIHIFTLSRLDSITETEANLNDYLSRFIPGMGEVSKKLYGDVIPETWKHFADGLEGLQWIVSSFEFLHFLYANDSVKLAEVNKYCSQVGRIVRELDEEMQKDNRVGVADLFQYELLPILEGYLSYRLN